MTKKTIINISNYRWRVENTGTPRRRTGSAATIDTLQIARDMQSIFKIDMTRSVDIRMMSCSKIPFNVDNKVYYCSVGTVYLYIFIFAIYMLYIVVPSYNHLFQKQRETRKYWTESVQVHLGTFRFYRFNILYLSQIDLYTDDRYCNVRYLHCSIIIRDNRERLNFVNRFVFLDVTLLRLGNYLLWFTLPLYRINNYY